MLFFLLSFGCLIIVGVGVFVTDPNDVGGIFLNCIAVILGIAIFYFAKFYGETVLSYFTRVGFFSQVGFGVSSYIAPTFAGLIFPNITQKIYSYKSKIRMAILYLTILGLIFFSFLNNQVDMGYVSTYLLDIQKPNISFVIGGLLSIIFHPIEND
jgi:hypothetical protein